ncbi:hypothetical protein PMAC_002877 [Pneumocystis sp. 'macacae']|nr:hypothetical protein PMAC_002877 [Pneumocystis sp. 'macacae']
MKGSEKITIPVTVSEIPQVIKEGKEKKETDNFGYKEKIKGEDVTKMQASQATNAMTYSGRSPLKNSYNTTKEHTYTQRKTIGDWQLGKTVGSGSMGKVKLVTHCVTNEIAAVKIIPRSLSHGSHLTSQNLQDNGKEIRAIREIAISSLLQHPYICTLLDVKIQPNHYYVFFEYINGGQMLDYIISHGKLKEKQARKFARQIGSALDYCHRNSVVHRDLKIENILISKEGDIKIIDFGLSNLYSPHSQLSTFCGSLYFAAPELLNAKAYVGPEIDVWSFGVVLYVLVCGKVPFDDQNMPALHAKIKRGHVEYPSWLTTECKQLLSRMLVTVPSQRATLSEILNHPWMTRGYDCPPDNHFPSRFPITIPLDMEIVRRMTGFEFGSEQTIYSKLNNIIESEGYRKLVKTYYNQLPDTHVLSLFTDKKKTFFDFYKRKSNIQYNSISTSASESIVQNQHKVKPLYADAYHPLISIYYLVKEKIEREKKSGCKNSHSYRGDIFNASDISTSISAFANQLDHKIRHSTVPILRNRSFTIRTRAKTYNEKAVNAAIKDIPLASLNLNHDVVNIIPNAIANSNTNTAANGITNNTSTNNSAHNNAHKNTNISTIVNTNNNTHSTDNDINNLHCRIDGDAPALTKEPKERNFKLLRRFSSRKIKERVFSSQTHHVSIPPTLTPCKTPSTKCSSDLESPQTKQTGPHIKRSVSVSNSTYLSRLKSSPCRPSVPRTHPDDPTENSPAENKILPPAKPSTSSSFGFRRNRTKSLGNTKGEVLRKERKVHRQSSVLATHNTPPSQPYNSSSDITVKSGFLKGIFSVSTTSSKPPYEIKNGLVRVLSRLNISYRDIKGGFFCIYCPSIDFNTLVPPHSPHFLRRSISLHRPPFAKKKSVLDPPDDSDDSLDSPPALPHKHLPGFTIQFEIYIVKVPLFALHGLQFKRMTGNAWQYRSLASRIIAEMKL